MRRTHPKRSAMSRGVTFSEAWLRANGYTIHEQFDRPTPPPPPAPPLMKLASELRRGDEIRRGSSWVSVCEAEPGEDGRIRIVLAGNRLFGWLSPTQQIEVRRGR